MKVKLVIDKEQGIVTSKGIYYGGDIVDLETSEANLIIGLGKGIIYDEENDKEEVKVKKKKGD